MSDCTRIITYVISFAVDCSTALISGPYIYTTPTPATQGTVMSVTCAAGYTWTPAPTTGALNATCSNVSNSGKWIIPNGASCVCMFKNYNKIHTKTFNWMQPINFFSPVDCSSAVVSGPFSYTIPNPATIGNSMNVNCNTGLVWSTAPYSSAHTAFCSNVSNIGTWIINPSGTCLGIL